MKKKVKRNCPVCKATYHADPTRLKWGRQTTCSRRCSYRFRHGILTLDPTKKATAQTQQQTELQCPVCSKSFIRTPSKMKARHGVHCCSRECAYKVRKRTVTKPYNLVSQRTPEERRASARAAAKTRRRNAKPYPEAARKKAAANAIRRIKEGGGVSKFERKAADVFRSLGFTVVPSLPVRREDGTYLAVFDIFLPLRNLVIECHGTYWHGGRWLWDEPNATQRKNLGYERRKLILARSLGVDLRLLWEHEFKRDPIGAALAVAR